MSIAMTDRPILCFGGCTIDRFGRTADDFSRLYTSNIGAMHSSFGGAARNVAENLARLEVPVTLVTAIGDDADGRAVLDYTAAAGVDVSHAVLAEGRRTASYTAILNGKGELIIGLADMDVLDTLNQGDVAPDRIGDVAPHVLFIDANLSEDAIGALVARKPAPIAAGAVSVQKSARLRDHLAGIDILFLNRFEAEAITGSGLKLAALAQLLAGSPVPSGVVTGGADGAAAWHEGAVRRFPPLPSRPENVNGAGDALVAATLARLRDGESFFDAVAFGMAAAAIAVESPIAVHVGMSPEAVLRRLGESRK